MLPSKERAIDTTNAPLADERDHRSLNADKKRGETRARLLNAALTICTRDLRELPTVEDIVEKAKVSRGTFYKHFDSIEAVLAALGQDLTSMSLQEGERFRTVFKEKWKSTSVAFRTLLTRALLDPTWASFVLRTRGWMHHEGLLSSIVLQDLCEGRRSGEYHVLDDEVALDFLRGVLESCIASLHHGVPDPERYIDSAVHMWLQALGCEAKLCLEGALMSKRFLRDYASEELEPFFGR